METLGDIDGEFYESMSYEERRNFNLARNKEMMNLLFSGGEICPEKNDVLNTGGSFTQGYLDREPNESCPKSLASRVSNDIFCRDEEILRTTQFLDKGLFPSPPMLLYGPTATGKTFVCNRVLPLITSCASVKVSCAAASSLKGLIQGIWVNSLRGISRFNKNQLNISSSFEVESKIQKITSFSELIEKLASMMYCQSHIFKKKSTTKVPGLIIVFDEIDKTENLDTGLYRRLLSLSDICHPMIKVLATARSPPRPLQSTCILQCFVPYSNPQIVSILCDVHSKRVSDQDISAFKETCTEALPRLTITTRRIDELSAVVEELFSQKTSKGSNLIEKNNSETAVKALVQQPTVQMLTEQNARSSSVLIDDSLLVRDWYQHVPLKTKVLILAAFLASRNPPATDRTTFGNATKGRRKKSRSNDENSGQQKNATYQPQSFGAERLLGIYHQILPSIKASCSELPCNKYRAKKRPANEIDTKISIFCAANESKADKTKDEGLLYSTINTLVRMKILMIYSVSIAGAKRVKASDSNSHLLFLCTLSMSRAQELAHSIVFPLRDFLTC